MDEPAIIETISEITEAGVVVVAAAGNDGPSMG